MNLIIGNISNDNKTDVIDAPVAFFTEKFSSEAQFLNTGIKNLTCAVLSDKGPIIGLATDSQVVLIFIGHFLNSADSALASGASLDNPHATAGMLLSRYHEKKTSFLDGLIGYYGLCVFDKSENAIFLAGDPYGLRRLFYYHDGDRLIFSSSLAAAGLALGDELEIDRSLEDFLLSYDFLPWERTPYKGIKTLEKGKMLKWCQGKVEYHEIKKNQVWDTRLSSIDFNHCSEEKLIDHLYDIFITAIEEQLPAGGKIGVLLGGLDSALIASVLKRLGRDVTTYSFQFKDSYYNQKYTDLLASFAGITHKWVPISKEMIRKGLEDYAFIFNQTASQAHYPIQTARACAAMRADGIEYCFTGDGCDGIFMGYPNVYRRARLFEKAGNIPPVLLNFLLLLSKPWFFEKHLGHVYRVGRNYLTIWGRKMPTRGHIAYRVFDELTLKRLRGAPPPQENNIEEILDELSAGLEHLSFTRLAYHGKSMPGLNRTKLEGSSNFAGMVINSPYFHPGMISFANQLPEQMLRPAQTRLPISAGKYILVRMVEEKNLLPHEIIYQEKRSPVASPIDQWYASELKNEVNILLKHLPFPYNQKYIDNLLRPKFAEHLFRKLLTVDHIASQTIGLLLTYAGFAGIANKQRDIV